MKHLCNQDKCYVDKDRKRVFKKSLFKFESPIETILIFEQEDKWNILPISTSPYVVCFKFRFDKCVPIDYKFKRGFHHIYKEKY